MSLKYRSGSPGYWAGFILPAALLLAHPQSFPNLILLVGPLLLNTLLIIWLYQSEGPMLKALERLRVFYIITSIATLLLAHFIFDGSLYKIFTNLMLFSIYPYVFYNAIRYYPRSFTLGEGLVVTQAFLITFWLCVQNIPNPPSKFSQATDEKIVGFFVQAGFLGVIIATRVLVIATKPWSFLFTEELFCVWGKCCLVVMTFRMTSNDIWYLMEWILQFFSDRAAILSYWAACVAGSLGVVYWKNSTGSQASSSDRKLFHFLILFVYLPGVIKYKSLLFLASAALFYVFILVELIRFLQLRVFDTNFGDIIDKSVAVFRDEQDEGKLIITPIYLLAGCSVPVWLMGLEFTESSDFKIAANLAGLLSIGVGDTFASIGGSYFGGPKWRGRKKSASGTICCCVSQTIFIGSLFFFGWCTFSWNLFGVILFTIVLNSLVEALTDQIDNLVLPIITFDAILLGELLLGIL